MPLVKLEVLKFKSFYFGDRGSHLTQERKRIIEKRMEMIALLLKKQNEEGIKKITGEDVSTRKA
jgi:hypothetical protein